MDKFSLVIDTCNQDLFIAVVTDKVEKHSLIENIVKKSDILDEEVKNLIGADLSGLNSIYVTRGPGSFMGARVGLLYSKVLALFVGAKLFTASSFDMFAEDDGEYHIDAKGGSFYKATYTGGKSEIELVSSGQQTQTSFTAFLSDPLKIMKRFKEVKDFESEDSLYIKDPKIGGA